jgi:hypothetical protein
VVIKVATTRADGIVGTRKVPANNDPLYNRLL